MVKHRTRSIYVAIICMAVIVCIGATLAWLSFSARQEKNANIAVVDLNTTIELTSEQSIGAGDVVANNISFSRKDNSSDFYVRARLYYDKDTKTQDELKYIMVLNSQPIAVNNASESYKWVLNDTDGYYYMVSDLTSKTPLKVTSADATTFVFTSGLTFEGAVGLYSNIPVPTELKVKASIEAIQAKNITPTSGTITLEELTPYFVDTFGYETPKGFVVNYHANGGSTVNSEVFFTLDATPSLPTTSKLGYGFKGWYTDADCTTPFVAGTILTHDYNLYAKWGDMTVSVVGTDGEELISVPNYSGDLASLVASNATLQSGYNVYYDSTLTQGVDLYDNIAGRTLYLEEYTPNINMTLSSDGKAYEIAPVTDSEGNTSPAITGTFDTLVLPQYKYDTTTNTALPVTNILPQSLGVETFISSATGELDVKTIKFTNNNAFVNNLNDLAPAVCIPTLENILVDSGSVYTIKGNSLVKGDTLVLACLNTTFTSDITKIGDCAFFGLNITSINIPDTITEVGAGAFAACNKLADVTLPNTITEISDYMFAVCLSLKQINIPNNVMRIGDCAFMFCAFLESVTFPSSLKEIGEQAFSMNECLSEVVIPEGVTTIGNYAFIENYNLMSISIPKSVTTIEESIAWGPKLVHVRWLTNIPYSSSFCALTHSTNISDVEVLYDSSAFKNRLETTSNGLITYTVGDKKYLMGLTNTANRSQLTIPNTITDIWQFAFYKFFSSGLDSDWVYTFTSIVIPSSINSIGKNAFRSIESLTSVSFADTTNWVDEDGNAVDVTNAGTNATTLKNGTALKKKSVINFQKSDGTSLLSVEKDSDTLRNLITSNAVLQSGYNFYSDSALLNGIALDDTVSKVVYVESYTQGINMVQNTTNTDLYDVAPNGSSMCYTGSSTSIIIPQFVYSGGTIYPVAVIQGGSFVSTTSSITSVKISMNIEKIVMEASSSQFAFGLANLSTVIVDNNNTTFSDINNSCIINNVSELIVGTGDTKITGVTAIGDGAFMNNTKLTSITIPEIVKTIGKMAFSGCSNLGKVTFDDAKATWTVVDSEDLVSGDSVTVDDATSNASMLTVKYAEKYWYTK